MREPDITVYNEADYDAAVSSLFAEWNRRFGDGYNTFTFLAPSRQTFIRFYTPGRAVERHIILIPRGA